MTSYFTFNHKSIEYINHHQKVIIGTKTTDIYLPKKPLEGYEIEIINLSGHNINLHNNSNTDLIYNNFLYLQRHRECF